MGEARPAAVKGASVAETRLAWTAVVLAVVAGAALRWAWVGDIEWKKDEQFSYNASRDAGPIRTWPKFGMETSLHFPNPGLSVWAFIVIGRFAPSPTSMARVVQTLNVLALVGFAAAARAFVPAREREPWLWAVALQAVNPFAVRMSRKIWPPSVLPPFLLAFWVGHLHRRSRWGAFAWGLTGALMGQIHLSAWYVAAGLAAATAVADLRGGRPWPTRWGWWLAGGALGLLPALPWALAMPGTLPKRPEFATQFYYLIMAWACLYLTAATTLDIFPEKVLGLGLASGHFEQGPMLDGAPTYGVLAVRFLTFLTVLGVAAARAFGGFVWPLLRRALRAAGRPGGQAPSQAQSHPERGYPLARFYLRGGLLVPTVLYIFTVDVFFYHYFYVLNLLECLLLAVVVLPWRRALFVVVVAHALLSAAYLGYIHQNGGVTAGEYGVTYARQSGAR
jgi:hypothetical protein